MKVTLNICFEITWLERKKATFSSKMNYLFLLNPKNISLVESNLKNWYLIAIGSFFHQKHPKTHINDVIYKIDVFKHWVHSWKKFMSTIFFKMPRWKPVRIKKKLRLYHRWPVIFREGNWSASTDISIN